MKRDDILSAAKEIAYEKGISNVNIRLVAKRSNVSIGTIYNYYETKSDLIIAIVEDFWRKAFKTIDIIVLENIDFYDKVQAIYEKLSIYVNQFKENWIEKLSHLTKDEKKGGKEIEKQYFKKIVFIISPIIENEKKLNILEREKVAILIVDNMLASLRKNKNDFTFFIEVLKKYLSD